MSDRARHHTQDVRRFLSDYAAAHPEDVVTIDAEVSDDQDATALIWSLAAQGRQPLLHLRNVRGLGVEVVCNTFGSRARIASLLGAAEADLHAAYQARANKPLPPELVEAGPVTERVISGPEVDLHALPMLRHFDTDRAK